MFLAPSRSDLGESLPTINLLGVYLGELAGKTPIAGVPGRGTRQRSTEEFDGFLQIRHPSDQRWNHLRLRIVGLNCQRSSHLIDTTSMKALRQEQLSKTTSAEILLPQLAEEIESLSLSERLRLVFLPEWKTRLHRTP